MLDAKSILGKGFQFPMQIDSTTGKFRMVEAEDDIKEAIYLILKTRPGERAMEPDFGCDIDRYIFDVPDASADIHIVNEIEEALTNWEPRIQDIEVRLNKERIQEGLLVIQIGYKVRITNNPNNLVFPYYLEEGISMWR